LLELERDALETLEEKTRLRRIRRRVFPHRIEDELLQLLRGASLFGFGDLDALPGKIAGRGLWLE
jgi:hypothetical protein